MLNGLWDGRRTGTASLHAKMLKKLFSRREEDLHAKFLDLNKVYSALDREIFLGVLEGHVVGPWDRRLLHMYKDLLTMSA